MDEPAALSRETGPPGTSAADEAALIADSLADPEVFAAIFDRHAVQRASRRRNSS
jgi:hypothetical protein